MKGLIWEEFTDVLKILAWPWDFALFYHTAMSHIHARIHTYVVYMHASIHICAYMCVDIYMCAVHVCVCVFIYIYMRGMLMHIYNCTNIHLCIYLSIYPAIYVILGKKLKIWPSIFKLFDKWEGVFRALTSWIRGIQCAFHKTTHTKKLWKQKTRHFKNYIPLAYISTFCSQGVKSL